MAAQLSKGKGGSTHLRSVAKYRNGREYGPRGMPSTPAIVSVMRSRVGAGENRSACARDTRTQCVGTHLCLALLLRRSIVITSLKEVPTGGNGSSCRWLTRDANLPHRAAGSAQQRPRRAPVQRLRKFVPPASARGRADAALVAWRSAAVDGTLARGRARLEFSRRCSSTSCRCDAARSSSNAWCLAPAGAGQQDGPQNCSVPAPPDRRRT